MAIENIDIPTDRIRRSSTSSGRTGLSAMLSIKYWVSFEFNVVSRHKLNVSGTEKPWILLAETVISNMASSYRRLEWSAGKLNMANV